MQWLLYAVLALFVSYWVIRLGVYHGVRDADRSWARSYEEARRRDDES